MRVFYFPVWIVYAAIFSNLLCAGALFSQGVDLDGKVDLNRENYAEWRDHIVPSESELKFLSIPWERTLEAGVARANSEDKPILLWAMNGHPLGCT